MLRFLPCLFLGGLVMPVAAHAQSPSPQPLRVKWTKAQLLGAQAACTKSALQSSREASQSQAESYCKCILEISASRWAYADFTKNEVKYVQRLDEQGMLAKCAATARKSMPAIAPTAPVVAPP